MVAILFSLSFISFATGQEIIQAGDFDESEKVDLTDAISMLNHLFKGGAGGCEYAGDVNNDLRLDITDAIYILQYLFAGGEEMKNPQFIDKDVCPFQPANEVNIAYLEGKVPDEINVDGSIHCLPSRLTARNPESFINTPANCEIPIYYRAFIIGKEDPVYIYAGQCADKGNKITIRYTTNYVSCASAEADLTMIPTKDVEEFKGDTFGLVGGKGKNYIIGTEYSETISMATSEKDSMAFGKDGNDKINGGYKNDYLNGDGGSNTIYGLDGNDYITSHGFSDKLNGGYGKDLITSYGVNSIIYGGEYSTKFNSDILESMPDIDEDILYEKNSYLMVGGDGNDILMGGTLRYIRWFGGGGDDIILLAGIVSEREGYIFGDHFPNAISVKAEPGTSVDEGVVGSLIHGDDVFITDNTEVYLIGDGGDDIFFTSGGTNVYGDAPIGSFLYDNGEIKARTESGELNHYGNDLIFMESSWGVSLDALHTEIIELAQRDWLKNKFIDNDALHADILKRVKETRDYMSLLQGELPPAGGLVSNVEKNNLASGGCGDDIIVGSSYNDIIYGGYNYIDDKFCDGGQDQDRLYGMRGDDTIYGGTGEDVIYGSDGNDLLYGDYQEEVGIYSPWTHSFLGKKLINNYKDYICGGSDGEYVQGSISTDRIIGDLAFRDTDALLTAEDKKLIEDLKGAGDMLVSGPRRGHDVKDLKYICDVSFGFLNAPDQYDKDSCVGNEWEYDEDYFLINGPGEIFDPRRYEVGMDHNDFSGKDPNKNNWGMLGGFLIGQESGELLLFCRDNIPFSGEGSYCRSVNVPSGLHTWGSGKAWEDHPGLNFQISSPLEKVRIAGDEFEEVTLPDCAQVGPSGTPPDQFPLCEEKDGNVCCVCVKNCQSIGDMSRCLLPTECSDLNDPEKWPLPEGQPRPEWETDDYLWCNFPTAEVQIYENEKELKVINGENYNDQLREAAK